MDALRICRFDDGSSSAHIRELDLVSFRRIESFRGEAPIIELRRCFCRCFNRCFARLLWFILEKRLFYTRRSDGGGSCYCQISSIAFSTGSFRSEIFWRHELSPSCRCLSPSMSWSLVLNEKKRTRFVLRPFLLSSAPCLA